MSLRDDIRARLGAAKISYWASHDRTLGKSVWAKLNRLDLPSVYQADLAIVRDHSVEMEPDAWHLHVGEIARSCPKDMPRGLRLRWVLLQLMLGRRTA